MFLTSKKVKTINENFDFLSNKLAESFGVTDAQRDFIIDLLVSNYELKQRLGAVENSSMSDHISIVNQIVELRASVARQEKMLANLALSVVDDRFSNLGREEEIYARLNVVRVKDETGLSPSGYVLVPKEPSLETVFTLGKDKAGLDKPRRVAVRKGRK